MRDCLITNSMYRGIYVDKANHTNFTNYESADFTNTVVRGTGGPNAKTSNIGLLQSKLMRLEHGLRTHLSKIQPL